MTKTSDQKAGMSRRELFQRAVELTAVGAVVSVTWGAVDLRDAQARWLPRPPGALKDGDFAAACARCGQCVTACPYDTLSLAGANGAVPMGTPYFDPERIPCYMCEDMPCVKACPTGALDKALESIADARMGVAVIDPSSCLSYQGLRCEICYRDCPVQGKALTVDPNPRQISRHAMFIPVIHPDKCTGCGMCVKSCPTDRPAIRIADRKAVLGEIGRHYRLGWLPEDDPKNLRREPQPATPAAPSGEKAGGLDFLNETAL